MKIDSLFPTSGNQRLDSTKNRRKGVVTKRDSAIAADSSVALTDISARLQEIETQLAGIDNIDSGKVEATRQAIAEGRYGINEDAIAERLVHDIVEDLRRQAKA